MLCTIRMQRGSGQAKVCEASRATMMLSMVATAIASIAPTPTAVTVDFR